jgi:hypothetical protein
MFAAAICPPVFTVRAADTGAGRKRRPCPLRVRSAETVVKTIEHCSGLSCVVAVPATLTVLLDRVVCLNWELAVDVDVRVSTVVVLYRALTFVSAKNALTRVFQLDCAAASVMLPEVIRPNDQNWPDGLVPDALCRKLVTSRLRSLLRYPP